MRRCVYCGVLLIGRPCVSGVNKCCYFRRMIHDFILNRDCDVLNRVISRALRD